MAEQKKRGPGRPPGSKNKNKSNGNSSGGSNAPKTKQKHIQEVIDQTDRDKRTIDVIWSITLVAVGIFLLFTVVFDTTGAFGMKIHDICLGLFGIMAYVLPFLFIISGILLLLRKLQHISGRTVTFGILMFFMMCIMNSARFLPDNNPAFTFADIVKYFKLGVEGQQGGAVGMELGALLVKGFGKPGLWIFSIAVLVISIFLVANTPISRFFENISNKRETRRLKAEIEAAEQAKVQQAVASTATVGADPVTGIVQPLQTPQRVINGGREADLQDTFVQPVSQAPENKKKSTGFFNLFNRNTIQQPVKDNSRYDDESVGSGVSRSSAKQGKRYGLGDPDDFGNSGTRGLANGDSYNMKSSGTGAARRTEKKNTANQTVAETDSDADKPKRVIRNGIDTAAAASAAGAVASDSRYQLPPIDLLKKGTASKNMMTEIQLEEKADLLEQTLSNFGVDATVTSVTQGASVTRYEIQPAIGVKVNSITRLADDIALNLRAKSLRIEAPIPGKAAVGIEVENSKPSPVLVRDIIESREFADAPSKLEFVVGKDISGGNIVANLADMPHLLIAGATGSGKSVCINTIIASFLYKAKPSELKLIMVDPKVVELGNYNSIPHMLIPVVTDPRKASRALAVAVKEMDDRYEKFAEEGVRDLASYNSKMKSNGEPQNCRPEIVIIIDELADLMMAASNEVENSICRLAQKARAAGMHLIVATQRPSVDVVTGLIKANIPSRIAFSVSSQFDSRTILDTAGAEKLLGKGDMLFSPVGCNKPMRVQGPYISDAEISKLISFVSKEGGSPVYDKSFEASLETSQDSGSSDGNQDDLTEDAIAFILKQKQASVSMLQRRFRIGYNRAARIIDEIEEKGIIGPSDGSRPRQVLTTEEEYYGGGANAAEIAADLPVEEPLNDIEDARASLSAATGEIAFDSLPDSVKRQILDADAHDDY